MYLSDQLAGHQAFSLTMVIQTMLKSALSSASGVGNRLSYEMSLFVL